LLEDRGDVTSPLGTRWTTDLNNPGATITSANHAALEFDSWLNAYRGPNNAGRNVVGRDAVLHLITDDIYLDIRFTAWSQGGSGGGFAYLRAEPREIIPEPAVGSLLPVGLILLAAVTWWRTVYTKLYSAVVRGRTPLVRTSTVFLLLLAANPTHAAFHLWHVKEVFSNADGSVQFIELFNSFSNEQFVQGHRLIANSDGVIKTFTIPSNLVPPAGTTTANTHFLVATPSFGSLPGAVTPNYTLPDPSVSGPFFNPNANSITITFDGSNDSLTFSGSLLPKDGFNGLTDTNATGFPPGTPNIQVLPNTPTRFPNTAGQIDLRSLTGDHNGDGRVDAADYVVWRKTDGSDQAYNDWRTNFGATRSASAQAAGVPEPATLLLLLACFIFPQRRRRLR